MSWANKAWLSLESLDARIVPSATPVLPDPGPAPPANVSASAPPAPRPPEQIQADIQNVLQQLAANQRELDAAHDAELAHYTGPLTTALLKVADIEAALLAARDEDKPYLEFEHQRALDELRPVSANQDALFAARVRLQDIRAGLNAMLQDLEDELRRAKPGQAQTDVNPPPTTQVVNVGMPQPPAAPQGGN